MSGTPRLYILNILKNILYPCHPGFNLNYYKFKELDEIFPLIDYDHFQSPIAAYTAGLKIYYILFKNTTKYLQ